MSLGYSKYALDTGHIYIQMCQKWTMFYRDLFIEVEDIIKLILINEKRITVDWNGDKKYFESKINQIIYRRESSEKDPDFPTYTEHFIGEKRVGYYLTGYEEPFHLLKNSYPEYYNLFFVLNLLISDPYDFIDIFNYHLNENFDGNKDAFDVFLKVLFVKYNYLLNDEKIQKIYEIYLQSQPNNDSVNSSNNRFKDSETPTSMKVLAIHYLFQEFNVNKNRIQQAEVRFIKMLTGNNETLIRDILRSPLVYKKPAFLRKDLTQLIKYFGDLKMDNIVNSIYKDLSTIENDK